MADAPETAADAPAKPRSRGKKLIISCAVTGAVHTPTMSPHLPYTPNDIATQAVDAAKAGAAILHLHARDPEDGRPSPKLAHYEGFVPRIRQQCDAVINITTGGSTAMTMEQRLEGPLGLSPEICSLNMGSMNFVYSDLGQRYQTWRFPWEKPYVEATKDVIFRNTFGDIETILREMGERRGARFEYECYDVGHLYTLAHFLDRKLATPPLFVQMVFGILGGIGADPDNLMHMKTIADRLFGDAFEWSVLAAGRHQINFATMAAAMGGHVRVGLEDSLYAGPGKMAESNAEQVAKIRRIVEELGRPIASPEEARTMLGVPSRAAAA
ncbi:3-keto-5-aminohexanoate cleavage protein [Tistrella mobilis]|uniref:3-keto-5-aminohexanoate cleavage protein n=1 Tax=Tistrella mobilis TaxID=171437 RepID=UPI00355813C6